MRALALLLFVGGLLWAQAARAQGSSQCAWTQATLGKDDPCLSHPTLTSRVACYVQQGRAEHAWLLLQRINLAEEPCYKTNDPRLSSSAITELEREQLLQEVVRKVMSVRVNSGNNPTLRVTVNGTPAASAGSPATLSMLTTREAQVEVHGSSSMPVWQAKLTFSDSGLEVAPPILDITLPPLEPLLRLSVQPSEEDAGRVRVSLTDGEATVEREGHLPWSVRGDVRWKGDHAEVVLQAPPLEPEAHIAIVAPQDGGEINGRRVEAGEVKPVSAGEVEVHSEGTRPWRAKVTDGPTPFTIEPRMDALPPKSPWRFVPLAASGVVFVGGAVGALVQAGTAREKLDRYNERCQSSTTGSCDEFRNLVRESGTAEGQSDMLFALSAIGAAATAYFAFNTEF